jgi:hypothetical protein
VGEQIVGQVAQPGGLIGAGRQPDPAQHVGAGAGGPGHAQGGQPELCAVADDHGADRWPAVAGWPAAQLELGGHHRVGGGVDDQIGVGDADVLA